MIEEPYSTMDILKIEKSWLTILQDQFEEPYFLTLISKYKNEKKTSQIYPESNLIFEAFNKTIYENVKVIIIGQDPYHGEGQADGLCFSVNDGIRHPPSLKNVLKELSLEINCTYPQSGNLQPWAEQGVLLLNATLTVRKGEANSHINIGWKLFTDSVIEKLSTNKSGLIFLLWGEFAKQKGGGIDQNKHHVLTSGHPSPLSANKGLWFNNGHFTKTNELLIEQGKDPINWQLV